MPRLMSFAYTVDQVRARTKTVTRRDGWRFSMRGDVYWAVPKAMGLKKGETIERLSLIRVVRADREGLYRVGDPGEMELEGFPDMHPNDFCAQFFPRHRKADLVTRIEFEYLD